jgi:hypothetical protein
LIVIRLQVFSDLKREVAAANDRPARKPGHHHDAHAGAPGGPGRHVGRHNDGISVLEITHCLTQRVGAAAVLTPATGPGAADELDTEPGHRRADQLGIAVAGHHRRNLRLRRGPEARRHHELTMPHGNDARVVAGEAHERVLGLVDGP